MKLLRVDPKLGQVLHLEFHDLEAHTSQVSPPHDLTSEKVLSRTVVVFRWMNKNSNVLAVVSFEAKPGIIKKIVITKARSLLFSFLTEKGLRPSVS